jgi:GNAT superfamily N-acetyltransferase
VASDPTDVVDWRDTIAPATTKDVRSIIRLVEEAGWAYTRAELERLIEIQPSGMLLSRSHGLLHEVIGCVYASVWGRLGFIGLMLVKEGHRGQGLGRALMMDALERFRAERVPAVGLDAVEAAVNFYQRLGFRSEWISLRFGLETSKFDLPEIITDVRVDDDVDLARAVELDRAVSGVDRGLLLERLHADDDCMLMAVPGGKEVLAYGVLRRSKGCLRLGPLVGVPGERGMVAARAVLARAVHETYPRMMTVNVPDYNGWMVEELTAFGAVQYSPCVRMYNGDPGPARRPEGIWALGAAEKG